ncbi:hypothetical protein HPB51_011141 [Rhipicephalus microplus]|uniref:Uncharacterized protein n=1 Tax=Rhipicephalus microplus TaxID=6941 RepID=A0A9J6E041_RHIMP|nr:hypothetical protein HPB51_011141 [Rhipicephalus microplus]
MRAHYCTYARQPPRRSNIRARGTISANAKPEGRPDKKTNGYPTRTDAKAKQGSPLLRNVQDRREETSLPSSIGPSSLRYRRPLISSNTSTVQRGPFGKKKKENSLQMPEGQCPVFQLQYRLLGQPMSHWKKPQRKHEWTTETSDAIEHGTPSETTSAAGARCKCASSKTALMVLNKH